MTPQADGLQALACQGEMNIQATMQLFGIMMAVMLSVSLIVFITEYFKLKKNISAQLGDLQKELEKHSTKELMQEVAALCDEIVIISSGKVAMQDTPDGIRATTGCDDLEEAFVKAIDMVEVES